ncbi:MAG: ATP-grasp domain-containing protein [Candidatus Pacebacteria bacterium]|nr:ATP-grasp domain-containing protein [Candidatus Paceibacterota bacterium]
MPTKNSTVSGSDSKEQTLLVVNTGNTLKRFIFQELKKLPVKVVAINSEKNWAEPYVDDWILVDTTDHLKTQLAVKKYSKNHPVHGVITFWEDDVLLTSKLTDMLSLPGVPLKVAQSIRNKYEFRALCKSEGLPTPKYIKATDPTHIEHAKQTLQFPLVIKPVYGTSSAYVIKVLDVEELDNALNYIKTNISSLVETSLHEGTEIMIEEYIDGDEVDIDMLLQNGKLKFWSITDNHACTEPFFIETGDTFPSILDLSIQKQLVDMAETILEKFGVTDGLVHFEAKYTSKGPVPIEVNLRLGGGYYYSFIKRAWGVDLIKQAVNIAVGTHIPRIEKPAIPKEYFNGFCFIQNTSGIISSLDFPEKFDKSLRVHDFTFFNQLGDTILTPPASYDYLGWITAAGDTPQDAEDNLEKAKKLISYEIVPFSNESNMGRTQRTKPSSPAWLQPQYLKGKARLERLRHTDRIQQRTLKIGIACNAYSNQDGSVESELASVGNTIQNTLNARGYTTTFLDFNNIESVINILKSNKIDLVFNVGERLNSSSLLEPHIASLFDMFQVPYTGSNPLTLGFCIDKIKVKKLLTYHEIPTAKWDYIYNLEEKVRDDLSYPLIVKPSNTDNSIGITQDSVVRNPEELKKQMTYVIKELGCPALIEEYLEGDEYDVSIIGTDPDNIRVLPLSRTVFSRIPKGMWNIYSFDSKWAEQDFKSYIDEERPPKKVNKKLLSLITEIALDTYSILECHDYGRVEIKLDGKGNPHVLELNPNPSINTADCLPSVAALSGIDYGDFLEEIIASAIKRYKDKPAYSHLQPSTIFK